MVGTCTHGYRPTNAPIVFDMPAKDGSYTSSYVEEPHGGGKEEDGGGKEEDGGGKEEDGGEKEEDGGGKEEDGGGKEEDGGEKEEDGASTSAGPHFTAEPTSTSSTTRTQPTMSHPTVAKPTMSHQTVAPPESTSSETARQDMLLRGQESLLGEKGPAQVRALRDALDSGTDVLCGSCGDLVAKNRWDAHRDMWCRALDEL